MAMETESWSDKMIGRTDSSDDENLSETKWSELSHDVLGSIARGFGIVDLISFRSVCKEWNSASATASAEIESSQSKEPWFLLYGEETSNCLMLSNTEKKYTFNIPELNSSATCMASDKGWLLLRQQQEEEIYFFCPFSRAKIHLPKLPINLEMPFSYCMATFSSQPTSQDCIVSVICRNENAFPEMIELYVLRRGDKEWERHTYTNKKFITKLGKIRLVTCQDGDLHILDGSEKILVTYSFKNSAWKTFDIVPYAENPSVKSLPYVMANRYFKNKGMAEKLGLKGNGYSISICGSAFKRGKTASDSVIFCENIEADKGSKCRRLKGVWIHPRFFVLPPDQSW